MKKVHITLKKISFLVIMFFLLLQSCSQRFGIERGYKTAQRLDIEEKKGGSSLIRTRNFDIYIEPNIEYKWIDKYANQEYRVPKFNIFQLIISNESNMPLSVKYIKLVYGQNESLPLHLEDVKKRTKSPAYGAFNFKGILANKRYFGKANTFKKIDYEKDALEYRFDFINPGEKIIKFVVFDWIPVQFRSFKILINIAAGLETEKSLEKTVTFDFLRYEYRTHGKYFLKPGGDKKETDEEEDY